MEQRVGLIGPQERLAKCIVPLYAMYIFRTSHKYVKRQCLSFRSILYYTLSFTLLRYNANAYVL